MFRTGFILLLIGLLSVAPAAADSRGGQSPAPSKSGWTGKRVAWTIVGAAAGFGAGVFFGLNKFDDAINCDRKVWTSALVGAAAGGVGAALLSRNIGSSPRVASVPSGPRAPETLDLLWTSALRGTVALTPLSRRTYTDRARP